MPISENDPDLGASKIRKASFVVANRSVAVPLARDYGLLGLGRARKAASRLPVGIDLTSALGVFLGDRALLLGLPPPFVCLAGEIAGASGLGFGLRFALLGGFGESP